MVDFLAHLLAEGIYWLFFILIFLGLAFLDIWLFIKLFSWADRCSEKERQKHKNDKLNY